MKPLRAGLCSTRNAVELPNSPPAEKPCSKREMKMSAGAASPMDAYGGLNATMPVPFAGRAEHQRTARTREIREREGAEREQQRHRMVIGRKEQLRQHAREI